MILQQAEDLSMVSCGYPYYVGGVFDDRNQLLCTPVGAVRNPSFFLKARGIVARTATEVTSIDRTRCVVSARNLKTKEVEEIAYDRKFSLRGYEVARVLEGHGWKNVKVMEGGIAAWPYPRER